MCKEEIIGKYKVTIDIPKKGHGQTGTITSTISLTDNATEAIWVANKRNDYIIHNVCGEYDFYKGDNGRWYKQKQQ